MCFLYTPISSTIKMELNKREIKQNEKSLILLVLDESVKIGELSGFSYLGINDINHTALQRISYIKELLVKKKILFEKIDQRSYLYTRILEVAKITLRHLQYNNEYGYYEAELIHKFIQIEDIFGERKLKPISVRFIDEQEIYIKEKEETKQDIIVDIDEEGEPVYIPEGLNGKKMNSYIQKEKEQNYINETLKENNFID